jgi:hypothetical protein
MLFMFLKDDLYHCECQMMSIIPECHGECYHNETVSRVLKIILSYEFIPHWDTKCFMKTPCIIFNLVCLLIYSPFPSTQFWWPFISFSSIVLCVSICYLSMNLYKQNYTTSDLSIMLLRCVYSLHLFDQILSWYAFE